MAHQPRALSYHGSVRAYSDGQDDDYFPPEDENRSAKGDKKGRKRNSVACNRCRKRKIKCTGDRHDGNGCEACQAAGVPSNNCYYLRVNSHHLGDVSMQSAPEAELLYSSPPAASFPSTIGRITTSDPSQYALGHNPMLPAVTAAPFLGQSNSRVSSYSELPNMPFSAGRQQLPLNSQTSFDGNLPSQYDMQTIRVGLPLHVASGSMSNYSTNDQPQYWTSLASNSRSSSYNNFASDQDVSPSFTPSTFSYLATSGPTGPSGPAESGSVFPGLSPLVTYLPSQSVNRTLPVPSNVQTSVVSSSGSGQDGEGEFGLFPHCTGKSSNSSRPNPTIMRTSQGSVSSVSQDSITASGPPSSTSSSSPSDSQDTSQFGYVSLAHSSEVESGASASGYRGVYAGTSLPRTLSNRMDNGQLPSLNSPYSTYGVNANLNGSLDRRRAAEARMRSQSSQTEILHPQPRHRAACNAVINGALDTENQSRGKIAYAKIRPNKSSGKK